MGYSDSYPSPPVQAYLWTTSFIGRIFPVYTRGRHDLSSFGVVRRWLLEGVRIWKLSRTYPDEKPTSFSVLKHRCSLITRKPTWYLMIMLYILVRIGAPYEGWWSTPFHLPRNYGIIFNPRLKKYIVKYNKMWLVNANNISSILSMVDLLNLLSLITKIS